MKKVILLISIIILSLNIFGCSTIEQEKENNSINTQEEVVKNEETELKNEVENNENKEVTNTKENDSINIQQEEVISNEEKEAINNDNKVVKTIVIDPGHSSVGNSEREPIAPNSQIMKTKDVLGATGVVSNIPEHITTVSISKILKEKLINMGFNVIMTKDGVEQSLSNIDRAKIGNEANADLVIRIHADSCESSSVKGASVLVPPKNEYTKDISDISKEYGKTIIDTYTKELNINNRGVIYRDDMTGFNWSEVPVIILEMGYLSNKEEDLFLSDEKNHEKIANSIANGIQNAFKLTRCAS